MARKNFETLSEAMKTMKPGETKDLMVKHNLITVRKGKEESLGGLTANLYTPLKRAKAIIK